MTKRIELARFPKRPDAISFIAITAHLLLVVAPLYLAAWLGPGLSWIALWLCSGLLMNGLLNLMHECAHYHVFRARGGSDFLGRWVLGPLAISDFDGYRSRHWKHHTHFGTDADTKDAYLVDIHGFKLFFLFLRCLAAAEALRKFRHQTAEKAAPKQPSSPLVWMGRTAIVHTLLLASLLLVAGPLAGRPLQRALVVATLAYVLVYVYALASLTVFAATLRAIAEHQLEFGQLSSTGRAALRNFHCDPFSLLVFGAYGFAEHGTHHREPGLPYYRLREVTLELAREDPDLLPNHQYLGELATLIYSSTPGRSTTPGRQASAKDSTSKP